MRRDILRAGLCMAAVSALLLGCGRDLPREADRQQTDVSAAETRSPEQLEEETSEKTEEETKKPSETAVLPEKEEAEIPEKVPEESLEEKIGSILGNMTLEEKVAQMFIVLPEGLTGAGCVTAAGETTRDAIREVPVGGFIYMEQNLESASQVQEMLSNVQSYSMERIGLPAFTCVDEEGGTVARISGRGNFDVPAIGDMCEVGASGDPEQAYMVGKEIGGYLGGLGFNVDFAPDADVLSNPENQVVRWRSFGSDPQLVAEMAAAELKGLREQGVLGAYKHFPGHGATAGDTHEGYACTDKSLEELQACELIPFQRGIQEGVPMIMVGHISLPSVTGDGTPASLSEVLVTEVLRNQMGYEGIVVTDAMNMGAVANTYTSAQAAVAAVSAGVDIILMPMDFYGAYEGILDAVRNQTISPERIDASLERILRVKLQMME